MQSFLDKAILASRYILVVFYLGLAIALGLFALRFTGKLWAFGASLFTREETDALIDLLHLVDSALVASLVVMVALSSYDSLVSRLSADAKAQQVEWVSSLDPGNLKIKVATAIIAISSIHLLQMFLKVETFTDRQIIWGLAIHGIFLAGALALGALDRMTSGSKAKTKL